MSRRADSGCPVAGCGLPLRSKGYCSGHYQRMKSGRSLTEPPLARRARAESVLTRVDGNKMCIGCTRWLPEGEFYANKVARDGLNPRCKRCQVVQKYGWSSIDFERVLDGQGGACAVCGALRADSDVEFHVDHDHGCCDVGGGVTCGRCIRGIVCPSCNLMIGFAEKVGLEAARGVFQYLERKQLA